MGLMEMKVDPVCQAELASLEMMVYQASQELLVTQEEMASLVVLEGEVLQESRDSVDCPVIEAQMTLDLEVYIESTAYLC